jgi:Alkylmercury lyase
MAQSIPVLCYLRRVASDGRGASDSLDARLRRYIYQHFIHNMRAPQIAELSDKFPVGRRAIRSSLGRLAASHAILTAENGEIWRAAPFSAVPTAFPVRAGRRLWWANCIWDALGIPAMLGRDARIEAACGCCNDPMTVRVTEGRLVGPKGIIHVAVPARHWYDDVAFT